MKIRIEGRGTAPQLHKNVRMADPLDSATKRLNRLTSDKQAKDRTAEDMEAISHAEFDGSLYWNEELGPYIPTRWLEASLKKAGGLRKLGAQVERSLIFLEMETPLIYAGPRDLAGLWADENFRLVVMANGNPSSRGKGPLVPRTRPMFRQWAFSTTAELSTSDLPLEELNRIGVVAGLHFGIGDWRPKHGRFEFNAFEDRGE